MFNKSLVIWLGMAGFGIGNMYLGMMQAAAPTLYLIETLTK